MSTARKLPAKGRPIGSSSNDPAIPIAFGRAVVTLRLAKGLSQEALALEASIGRTNISAIENGRTAPSLHSMVKIAAALGCSTPALMKEFEREHKALLSVATREVDA